MSQLAKTHMRPSVGKNCKLCFRGLYVAICRVLRFLPGHVLCGGHVGLARLKLLGKGTTSGSETSSVTASGMSWTPSTHGVLNIWSLIHSLSKSSKSKNSELSSKLWESTMMGFQIIFILLISVLSVSGQAETAGDGVNPEAWDRQGLFSRSSTRRLLQLRAISPP